MNFTSKQLKELKPCAEVYEWYLQNIKTEDLKAVLLQLNDHRPDWSRWLMVRVLNKEQNQRLAIYCAELVLPIYEAKYPGDLRVRECIQASKDFLMGKISKEELIEKRQAARDSYEYAANSIDDAYSSYAANAAYYAANVDANVANANDVNGTNAVYCGARAAAGAVDAAATARKELQLKIIDFAVELLEKEGEMNRNEAYEAIFAGKKIQHVDYNGYAKLENGVVIRRYSCGDFEITTEIAEDILMAFDGYSIYKEPPKVGTYHRFVNIDSDGCSSKFSSRTIANGNANHDRIACIEIKREYTVGEGLDDENLF